ncbi:unnamed protein product [Paramecium octaurelia]|uniref:Transmembrane protein n=1 Tax=Paramecium octaurelia TaxID=43137 RepID=A0A8S1YN99_PAROT|nr:unnamed protein product [Paramecium octaurelia]
MNSWCLICNKKKAFIITNQHRCHQGMMYEISKRRFNQALGRQKVIGELEFRHNIIETMRHSKQGYKVYASFFFFACRTSYEILITIYITGQCSSKYLNVLYFRTTRKISSLCYNMSNSVSITNKNQQIIKCLLHKQFEFKRLLLCAIMMVLHHQNKKDCFLYFMIQSKADMNQIKGNSLLQLSDSQIQVQLIWRCLIMDMNKSNISTQHKQQHKLESSSKILPSHTILQCYVSHLHISRIQIQQMQKGAIKKLSLAQVSLHNLEIYKIYRDLYRYLRNQQMPISKTVNQLSIITSIYKSFEVYEISPLNYVQINFSFFLEIN